VDEKELKKALSEFGDELDKKLEARSKDLAAITEKEAHAAAKAEIKAELEPELKKFVKMQEQLDAIETKMQRAAGKAAGRNFWANFKEDFSNKLKEVKNPKNLIGKSFDYENISLKEDMTQANSFESTIVVPVQYQPGIVYDPDRTEHIRDFISQGTTNSNMVSFIQEYANTWTNADVTTEGSELKQGDVDLKRVDAAVIKLSVYGILSEEMMEDVDGLTSYLMARLPSKLRNEEDDQILNHGTYGILTKATAYSDALADADISYYDILADAIRQIRDDEYQATAILLHPQDYTNLILTKDDNGQYVTPYAFMNGRITVVGVPVYQTTAMTAGTFLVGDFKLGAQVFDRRQISIEFTNTNEDNFVKDMVTVRCTERIAICVYRAKCFIDGTFAAAMANGSA
jgi:HK97 family phage major capsid protein